VDYCACMKVPRCPLSADEMTVTLYLQSVVERAKTFAPVKSASVVVAYFQKINMQYHLPTYTITYDGDGEASSLAQVRAYVKGKKGAFQWAQVVAFPM